MVLDDKIIFNKLNEVYQDLLNYYNEKNIFGLFVTGNANYGLAESEDELQFVMAKLPTMRELCLTEPEVYYDEHFSNVEVADWRLLSYFGSSQNATMMQCFYTDYYIVNDRYKKYYHNSFRANANSIFHFNPQAELRSAETAAKEAINDCRIANEYSGIAAMEAERIYIFIESYAKGLPCEQCIKPTMPFYKDYLLDIKHGDKTIDANELETNILKIVDSTNYDKIKDEQGQIILQDILYEVMQEALKKDADKEEFLNKLTDKESKALKSLLVFLPDGEGTVSLTKLIEVAEVSRPVFISLISKMKEFGIAEIKNQGVKGTYFKIYNYKSLLSVKE
jgi:hypothetical protein